MSSLKGKGVVVTGASRGLGRELAVQLARQGARVVLVARDGDALRNVVGGIRDAGGEGHALVADVGDKDTVYAIAGTAAELVGDVAVLINNASDLGALPMPVLLDTQCEDLAQVLEVNLIGPFRLTKAIAGGMVLRDEGVVVNISSDAAVSAYAGWGAYGVSKAALDHMTRTWAAELESTGVRFLAVDPGEMDTQMHADAMPEADRSTLARPADVAERIVAMIMAADLPSGARVQADSWVVPA